MKKIKLFGKYGIDKYALIDDKDFKKVNKFNWRLKNTGYISENSNNGIYLHRFIMDVKKGEYIDHINHNPLDNRKENLRICNNAINCWNKKYKKNIGVSKSFNGKNWRAYIRINGKQKWLGVFKNKEDGEKAYNEAVKKYRDNYSFLNIV